MKIYTYLLAQSRYHIYNSVLRRFAAGRLQGQRRYESEDPAEKRMTLVISSLAAGGAEKTFCTMANHWNERGWAVTIITFEPQGAVPFHPLNDHVRIIRLGLAPSQRGGIQAAWLVFLRIVRLRNAIISARGEIIISFMTRSNIMTLLSTIGIAVPIIVSERNNPREQHVNVFWSILRRLLYRRAACVTALTSEALDFYGAKIRKSGAVVPCSFALPPQSAARQGPPLIVAVGRLVEQKGFDLLLNAFSLVAEQCKDWNLVIWGEGPDRGKLERLRDELGLESRVRLPGLTREPYAWVYSAHIFVSSSRFEGLGNVIGEAMAAGLPVIAFDCDWGPRKFITQNTNGILVPPRDIGALAKAMVMLINNTKLRDQLAANARTSMGQFSPESVLAEWDRVVSETQSRSSHGYE